MIFLPLLAVLASGCNGMVVEDANQTPHVEEHHKNQDKPTIEFDNDDNAENVPLEDAAAADIDGDGDGDGNLPQQGHIDDHPLPFVAAAPPIIPATVKTRREIVGKACYISRKNDLDRPLRNSDWSEMKHFIDGFTNIEVFYKAIEDECVKITANDSIRKQPGESNIDARSRFIKNHTDSMKEWHPLIHPADEKFVDVDTYAIRYPYIQRGKEFSEYLNTSSSIAGLGFSKFKRIFNVTFDNEDGSDAGGLTRDFLNSVSAKMVENESFFARDENTGRYSINRNFKEYRKCAAHDKAGTAEAAEICYRNLGAMVAKACLVEGKKGTYGEGVGLPHLKLNYGLLRMLTNRPKIEDLGTVEKLAILRKTDVTSFYKMLLLLHTDEVNSGVNFPFGLDFDFAGAYWVLPLGERAIKDPPNDVDHKSTTSVRDYIDGFIAYTLGSEKRARAFKEGFGLVSLDTTDALTPEELDLVILGNPSSVEDVKKVVDEAEYIGASNNPNAVKLALKRLFESPRHDMEGNVVEKYRDLDVDEFRLNYLKFWFGASAIPVGQAKIEMSDHPGHFLVKSHTCFNALEIPKNYGNSDELLEKLRISIINGAAGFGIA